MVDQRYQELPQVSRLLEHAELQALRQSIAPADFSQLIRNVLEEARQAIRSDRNYQIDEAALIQAIRVRSQVLSVPKFRRVLNATGIVLHTNLGRSPMPHEAVQAAAQAASGYLNLELDLTTGKRSSRQDPIREDVCRITGAESATVVNNCAAATVIVLRALALNREVIVSRGQLIEIGGSFRIPDIMAVSGATLREVGTTNITRISDYQAAINDRTALLMRIHTSNYRIRGFTKTASIDELVELGKVHALPVVDDAGSGAALDLRPWGLGDEPGVAEGIKAGADLVLFSGDKLLGGPQAGIIAGRKDLIQRIEKDPLMRAFRLDKMTLAALESTLRLYRDPQKARQEIPTLRMLTTTAAELQARAEQLAELLRPQIAEATIDVRPDQAYVGGGSLPDVELPTTVVTIRHPTMSEETVAQRLRLGEPAVMVRVAESRVFLDPRTLFPEDLASLISALSRAYQS